MNLLSENGFGVQSEDARVLAEQLADILNPEVDGCRHLVSKVTPGEASTLKILNELARQDLSGDQKFAFVSNCRLGEIVAMHTILELLECQEKGGENG